MPVISDGSRIFIDMSQEESNLVLESQTYRVWNKITSLHSSQKGFLIAMGINSIFAASMAALEFFEPDPPPSRGALSWWLSGEVVAKNTQKWSLLISSLLITTVTALCANVFLKNQQQEEENDITPEMAAIIQSRVKEEILKRTSEISNLPT
ncbi:MAG: hypothetical protein ACRDDW_06510 [Candidatus Rhabdochlamydia sp.]